MENMAEALKIAFAVLMFVVAVTLSISSFSNARIIVDTVVTIRDKRPEYIEGENNRDMYNLYVQPTDELTRIVGIETVISTMYNAIISSESIEIYFFDELGNPFELYYCEDENNGLQIKKESGMPVATNCVKLELLQAKGEYAKELRNIYLDLILCNKIEIEDKIRNIETMPEEKQIELIDFYKDRVIYSQGLYEKLKDSRFVESFGEYTYEKDSKVKVITYKLTN